DTSRDWPGDTIHADGTVRTPLWKQGEAITPDQYDVVKDPSMRNRYGTRTLARAKPDTNFYYRMAAWPAAFEEGMIEANRRHFSEQRFPSTRRAIPMAGRSFACCPNEFPTWRVSAPPSTRRSAI